VGFAFVIGVAFGAWPTHVSWRARHNAYVAEVKTEAADRHATAVRTLGDALARQKRDLDAEAERSAAAVARAEAAEADLQAALGRTRVVYRDALKSNPSCAAWAAQPIPCPVSWR
jgi:hypothetical protein